MMYRSVVLFVTSCVVVGGWSVDSRASHPRLLLTTQDVEFIRTSLEQSPSFKIALARTQARVDRYFDSPPDVPLPKDAGGGYTHEQHKSNGIKLREAGVLYQLTGDEKYVEHARRLFAAYAEIYPNLGEHPEKKEQTPGRLFWQSLNESVWLVYAIQGYDAIYDALSSEDKRMIEGSVIRPMADFLSAGSPQTFNRIHNHGTWAVAAVGMTGYVLDDPDYVDQALYGLRRDGRAGFLAQLDRLISPDGYYTEGPYYQRYALMPVVLFARSIETNDPSLKIFEYRDGLILKAIYACLELAYGGLFFPINDSIREKGIKTVELRYGVAIAYSLTSDSRLLSIAQQQGTYELSGDGFRTALASDRGAALPYEHRSMLFRDGPRGQQGALAVLRNGVGSKHQALVFKATAQGMGHGHFDKLNWLFYDNGFEIVADYGAARFLNIEPKNGGRYLPENTSWAKQTIAHNTLVVDQKSHFDGDLATGELVHPNDIYFHSNTNVHVVAATMMSAYEDVTFDRTLILLDGIVTSDVLIVDVLNIDSETTHQYDLPMYFKGQTISAQPPLSGQSNRLNPVDTANGYQHLWLKAKTSTRSDELFAFTWLNDNRFYTFYSQSQSPMEILLVELGANDPDLNLRREQAVIRRREDARDFSFVSALEVHGEYNATEEFTVGSEGSLESITRFDLGSIDVIQFSTKQNGNRYLALSYDADDDERHEVSIGGREFIWTGYFGLFDEQKLIQH